MSSRRPAIALWAVAILVTAVGMVDAADARNWDLVVVLASSVVLQALVLAAGRIGPHPVALRPDLADWLRRQADATGERPALLADRAVAAYRAGLLVPTEDRADDRR